MALWSSMGTAGNATVGSSVRSVRGVNFGGVVGPTGSTGTESHQVLAERARVAALQLQLQLILKPPAKEKKTAAP